MIPFCAPGRAFDASADDILAAMERVGRSHSYILGREVEAFEGEFAAFCGIDWAVGVSNGTAAISLALLAVGLGPGARIATVANTCVPTVAAIVSIGARAVFIDVESRTLTMDPRALEEVASQVDAVVPVHLYGQCADMHAICAIAARTGIPVIEDCAQAHGARIDGQHAGSFGALGAFSFYPTKNLGALGDAGTVVTTDKSLAARVRSLRNYGKVARDVYGSTGRNERLDELQAAILRAKLPALAAGNARRKAIASGYRLALSGNHHVPALSIPPGTEHCNHLFIVQVADRSHFMNYMFEHGIETLVHYPQPIHQIAAYAEHIELGTALPVTERAVARVVSVPVFPELTDEEVERVAGALAAYRVGAA